MYENDKLNLLLLALLALLLLTAPFCLGCHKDTNAPAGDGFVSENHNNFDSYADAVISPSGDGIKGPCD